MYTAQFLCDFTGDWINIVVDVDERTAIARADMHEAMYAVRTRVICL